MLLGPALRENLGKFLSYDGKQKISKSCQYPLYSSDDAFVKML